MNSLGSVHILEKAIVQRKMALQKVRERKMFLETQSDMGWVMTLGVPEFGMLTAVASGIEVRKFAKLESQLEKELIVLEVSKNQLVQSSE